jgi:hypothetical protein
MNFFKVAGCNERDMYIFRVININDLCRMEKTNFNYTSKCYKTNECKSGIQTICNDVKYCFMSKFTRICLVYKRVAWVVESLSFIKSDKKPNDSVRVSINMRENEFFVQITLQNSYIMHKTFKRHYMDYK